MGTVTNRLVFFLHEYIWSLLFLQKSEDVGAEAPCWPQHFLVLRGTPREAKGEGRRGWRTQCELSRCWKHRSGDRHQTGWSVQLCEARPFFSGTFIFSYTNRSQYTNWCIIIFQEEQDIKALQAKNRKLGESLDQRQVSQFSNCNHTLTYIECCSAFCLIENISNSLDTLQVIEDELRERIERLETRQATDDASLLILNRYWNQVNMFRPREKCHKCWRMTM